ncbi:DUF3717 domain-containing protein [Paraburkholderia sp. Ac-20340]|uniref:DUF3717 domain-containing protein n=1 Tax=Paraburkholderia sp. Ac-20340 TaxID=2703888 RepID=UPI00197FA55A|nr:DUF3717 domain-containing protein [Paraburkholderia sp. Ac-20340]MBN3856706.1 DUF3717 domain-containing protein [Paraburkholderia sp. Ac-20340]
MTNTLTIAELEQAINFWCAREPPLDGALCARACTLADVYGLMIYERATTVDVSGLTPEQLDAVRLGLDYRPPRP